MHFSYRLFIVAISILSAVGMGIQTYAAYTPTSQDQQIISQVTTALQKYITRRPTLKPTLISILKNMKQKYQTVPKTAWMVDQLLVAFGESIPNGGNQTGCTIFPSDNPWNTDISNYPKHPNSDAYIASINAGKTTLHPDFGADRDGGPFGIPYVMVNKNTPLVPVKAIRYPEESDEGNFPIPLDAPIEKGGDKHVIAVDTDGCKLYEIYAAGRTSNGREGGSVAVFDLKSNGLRPDGRTSADAAGLPIYPGLVRYDEVTKGQINHALRFTVSKSQKAYIKPATHYASSSTDAKLPPMGLRVRLKADYELSRFTGQSRVILEALKKYGMIVADNGSDWYISGAPDARRSDEDLGQLKTVPGSAFEAVDTGPLIR